MRKWKAGSNPATSILLLIYHPRVGGNLGNKMQHYTKNTIGILRFCPTCNKMTMHRVDKGRVGCCLESHISGLSKKQEKDKKKEKNQLSLF